MLYRLDSVFRFLYSDVMYVLHCIFERTNRHITTLSYFTMSHFFLPPQFHNFCEAFYVQILVLIDVVTILVVNELENPPKN